MATADGVYSPIIDVAVGPFAIHQRHVEDYHELMARSRQFIHNLIAAHAQNVRLDDPLDLEGSFQNLRDRNWNARCLLAIEIENKVSRKHLMGGAINAAALGRIGLAVAWDQANLRAFVRLERYLRFLADRGKPTFPTANLLVLTKDQLLEAAVAARGTSVQLNGIPPLTLPRAL